MEDLRHTFGHVFAYVFAFEANIYRLRWELARLN